jgi:hypothetical protein
MRRRSKVMCALGDFTWRDFLEFVKREREWFEFLMGVASHRTDHLSRGEDLSANDIHEVIAEMLHSHARALRN